MTLEILTPERKLFSDEVYGVQLPGITFAKETDDLAAYDRARDEPAAGVPEAERQDLLATVAALPREVAVLLIEHDMDLVFSFADRISVLVDGALFTEGSAAQVSADSRVRAVYLGESLDG